MRRKLLLGLSAALVPVALAGWSVVRLTRKSAAPASRAGNIPVTSVKRGTVNITVAGRGELQGSNSQMLTGPMTGGAELAITQLREPGELVKEDDVVVQFDTTEQEFKLKEAEADLAEAEQQLIKAKAESEAKEEEARFAVEQARADMKLAELDVRRNPLLAAIVAKENNLALEAARDRLRQLEHDIANRKATSAAAIALQEAARNKAKVRGDTARRNIEAMTLRAKSDGYVNVQLNTVGSSLWGLQLPTFQVGDVVRPGMAVAQIPDLENWEVVARLGELDRGHLAAGQSVDIEVIASTNRKYSGKVKNLGGTSGPSWDRYFQCKMSLDNPTAELRPGMSARIVITTGVVKDALWLPSQALFELDGRTYVYLHTPEGFVPRSVKLEQRSESQVVLTGLSEGQEVAMANPDEQGKGTVAPGNASKAISR